MLMLSRKLLVNHQIYDHVDEVQEHHEHVEELKTNNFKTKKKKELNKYSPTDFNFFNM